MPVGMAIDILDHADMSAFAPAAGAVQCELRLLQDPNDPGFFLKNGHMIGTRLEDCCCLHNKNVHCKTLELPSNFHQVMVRYQFRTPSKGASLSREDWYKKCRRYVQLWSEFLFAEKRRQMQAPNVMWPRVPWDMNSLYDMPIVLWLSKPRKRKRGSPP